MISPFVDVEWCRANRPEIRLADVRFYLDGRSGREAYEAGHIPGAIFIDMDETLSAPHDDLTVGRHPLPTPQRFADGLSNAGISDSDTVIAYDDAGGVIAARLVWMLRATGHEAALLDGGLRSWAPDELEVGPAPPAPRREFTPVPFPTEQIVNIDEVADSEDVLIDARDRARFTGGPDPVDPRSGHIPGAISVPVREHLDPRTTRVARPEQLLETFRAAGIDADTAVISYCGSGVTACFNLLALEYAGLRRGRLFPGSWSAWSRDESRPIATGE
jgi:thiosulfate/3-mercaptopyruvate sulfurtransferase